MDISALTSILQFATSSFPGLPSAIPPVEHRGYQVILISFIASFMAQVLKVVSKLARTGQLDFRMMSKTGGMPSSHSATTMAMATSVGLIEGFDSVAFAIALCVAIIVMYDAAGVRRTVGLQAKVLNQMISEIFSEHPHISGERIKEFLGHTPIEVLVGAAMGILSAWTFNLWAIQRL